MPRLVDLAPRWWSDDAGKRVGVSFACPVHAPRGLDDAGSAPCMLGRVYAPTDSSDYGHRWGRVGEDFSSMSLSPSVLYRTVTERHVQDAPDPHQCTPGCLIVHWHGFVTKGEVSVLPDSVAA